ncbi:MAG TPA: thioredoxin domain-containing protein [Cyanobacteria bacterium UBA11149]|nr:thioredoxin domain-containing protein [Cyanobacteria bacterium UBA11367]HBE60851.1 thioredoxin domain-containing protein [Cyanobacteria bacterium UBA11366]HBK64203.1 thioredoxin domain-containing protein [Cyanobacteria bacterium UBA11166]HBR72186.1 thioredoxin domain-containing protein [Cyanobacteria bacterium UBA11159]HBS69762.1 thioredoxin domain-containing protein [Cyanobacteria bacterium UBA11153]HBW90023.1 thioredoxin domain-containing protein [Cyanobacteria bacterium UBA11149]HCA9312
MSNRLAQSQSLYLRKHAENPIDWFPWCDEALDKAKAENKPIFLSIGYSSCHWCTVMEGEAFSNIAIAQYMNQHFIPIKVDREERPDIDSIYMQTLQMMTGQGGWPLNVFLTPDDRVPFYGGTYFPVEPRYGRPGFLQVLQSIRRFYDIEKTKLESFKAEILTNLQKSIMLPKSDELSADLLWQGMGESTRIVATSTYGPSFPMMPYSDLALRGTRFEGESDYDARQAVAQRGLDLAKGGIYDHVAGGFHRYTVDATWTVPHFEKMLYDNGQIIEYLANLWSQGIQEAAFKRAVDGTFQWLKREMVSPQGFFYAAQDADNFTDSKALEPEEGDFYVWSYRELEKILTSSELAEIQQEFTVSREGNFEGKNVLQRRYSDGLTDTIEVALAKLFAVRYGSSPDRLTTFPPARNNQEAKIGKWMGRIPPVTDTKMIVAWNSLMISGLARASSVFRQPKYLKLAISSAQFILKNQWIDGRLYRINYEEKPSVLAQSEDYALLIKALLDLDQACLGNGESSSVVNDDFWLDNAVKIQEEFDELFWSLELGGYYNAASDSGEDLLIRERSYIDNATPSANGVAIANLVRLALITENLAYLDRAQAALQAFGYAMSQSPQACPSLFTALDWFRNSTLVRTGRDRIISLSADYFPAAMYRVDPNLPEDTVGLVCQGLSCKPTPATWDDLLAQVKQSQTRG